MATFFMDGVDLVVWGITMAGRIFDNSPPGHFFLRGCRRMSTFLGASAGSLSSSAGLLGALTGIKG